MTSEELLSTIRAHLDDVVSVNYRIADTTILQHASFAQSEFARATLAVYNISPGVVTGNDPWITLPDTMIVVKSVILNGLQLRPITASELDFGYYSFNSIENTNRFDNWRVATGTPKFVVTDMYENKIRLVPYTTSNSTVSIEGFIVPPALVFDGINPDVDPQIPEMYHELLVVGSLLRLYLFMDPDVEDTTRSQFYMTRWYQGIGEAQRNLRTDLRRQSRVMDLPRGFGFGSELSIVSADTVVK